MGSFPNRFQIRDLEEFSGVKAHTIRIWEKRYGLLEPERTDTNIRYYGADDLKAILNVSFLNQHGYKISKIAAMDRAARERLVQEVALSKGEAGDVLNTLKLAMLSFNEAVLESTSDRFEKAHGFRTLVERIYVPLLEHIGVLWQTNSICPAQEHFVSNFIRHKIIVATYALPAKTKPNGVTHVLYLPENEIHELGLIYLNYLLRSKGDHTIYLGQSVPKEDLKQICDLYPGPLNLVSVLMAHPAASEVPAYLKELRELVPEERVTFWVTGSQLARVEQLDVPQGMRLHPSLTALITAIDADQA
ncbi:MAG: MerR family transcriptional regulator [Flavobacteriales bacterium]|nr:MerR family transcriptional regulator [Flavobacteriales bacterium]